MILIFIIFFIIFQHAAEVEKKQNESEIRKCMGMGIQYGDNIQVNFLASFLLQHLCFISRLNSKKGSGAQRPVIKNEIANFAIVTIESLLLKIFFSKVILC